MSREEIIQIITENIYPNGNNEITANVLNPVLDAMVNQINDITGDLGDLASTDTSNLVNAINSVITQFQGVDSNSVKLRSGIDNPNVTPPGEYNTADFYIQEDTEGNPLDLWQFNGIEWTKQNSQPDGFTQLGTLQKTGNIINVGIGYAWIINDILFSNTIDQNFPIENESTGQSRVDIIVTDGNQFALIQGDSSAGEGSAAQPQIPVDSLLLTSINIYEDNISEPTEPFDSQDNIDKVITIELQDDQPINAVVSKVNELAYNVSEIESVWIKVIYKDVNGTLTRVELYKVINKGKGLLVLSAGNPYENLLFIYNENPTFSDIYVPLNGTEENSPVTGNIIGSEEFDKQGNRKAFVQLGDVEDANNVTEYERTHQFSNFNIQGLDGAIVSIGDSNLEGFYSVLAGENNWFSKLIKEIQSYRGGNSEKGFINFANPGIYGYTLSGTYTNVTAGASIYALKMQPNSEIAFTSSSKFVEIWFDKISTGGSLEFYYNDVLYRTISTSGSEINNYSFDNTETPSTANGTYRIKCVGSETTLTALFKSLFPEETLDNYSYMYNAIAGTSFVDFDFENIRLMTGITPNRDALFLNALGINSIYSSSRGTTPEQYGIDIKNSIKILNTENSSMVYIMPPRCAETTYPPINGAYIDFYNVAKRVCDDNGILFIDLNVIRGIYGDSIFGEDGLHFSELGHNAIYEYVSNQLSKVNIKTENLQQVTAKSNQTTNGIQIIKTPSDVNFDLSKEGLALGDVGFSLIKDGGAPTNIQFDKYYVSTNNSAPDRAYNSTSYNRSTDSATDPVRETITTNGYERLDKDGNKILSGDLRTSTALVGKYPDQDWAIFSHKNFRGSGNEMALIQAENGLTFLNSAPGVDLIFSIGLSEKARIRSSDGSLLVGGTVSVSNATESNHAVALGQVQTEIATVSDLTVALVVLNLYKYYALTGLSAVASLPPIAGNVGKTLIVTNKTTSNQTIYSNDGVTPDIWSIGGGSVLAHDFKGSITLFNDGAHWVITN